MNGSGSTVLRGRRAIDERAAAEAAAKITGAVPCREHLRRWAEVEEEYLVGEPEARVEILGLVRGICGGCPAQEHCAGWAAEDKYTGLAAGTWYFSGQPRRSRRATRARQVAWRRPERPGAGPAGSEQ